METLSLLELFGAVVGIIYLVLEYRASIWLWVASIVMPLIYMVVYYKAGLYADFLLDIYYMGAAVYGFLVWKFFPQRHQKLLNSRGEMPITHCPKSSIPRQLIYFAVPFVLLCWILTRYTNSTVPISDSFINALSILAMWQLARKYIEQWITWFVVDALSAALYFYKGLHFIPWLYVFYTVMAVWGYRKWLKMMHQPQ